MLMICDLFVIGQCERPQNALNEIISVKWDKCEIFLNFVMTS